MTLEALNALSETAAKLALRECCGSRAWASAMAAERPFRNGEHLHAAADDAYADLDRADLLEAFAAHPRIGERAAAGTGERHARWSAGEQSGMREADAGLSAELAQANREYEARFGHVFLICATGRSAPEMLEALRRRMRHDTETELAVASEEQRKIMHLRLEKLLTP